MLTANSLIVSPPTSLLVSSVRAVRAEYEERLAQAVAKAANLAQQLRTEKGNSGGGHGGDGGHSHSSHSLSPLPLSPSKPSLTAGGADSGFAAVQMALAETRLKVQQTGAASAPSPAPASLPWLTPTPHRLPPPAPLAHARSLHCSGSRA